MSTDDCCPHPEHSSPNNEARRIALAPTAGTSPARHGDTNAHLGYRVLDAESVVVSHFLNRQAVWFLFLFSFLPCFVALKLYYNCLTRESPVARPG